MSTITTTYEVFIQVKERWDLHANMPSDERAAAIAEAKTLSTIKAVSSVRVVRNDYNLDTGESAESIVYSRGRQGDFATGGAAAGLSKKPKFGIFTKLFGLAFGAFVVAILITWVATAVIESLPEARRLVGKNGTSVQLWVFLLAFVASFTTSAYAFISKEELVKLDRKASNFTDAEKKKLKKAMAPARPSKSQKRALAQASAKRSAERAMAAVLAEEQAVLAAQNGAQNGAQVDAAQGELEEPTGLEAAEETPADCGQQERPELSAPAEAMKMGLMTFLGDGLRVVAETSPKLDTFNKFGVNLYLAGACERMGLDQGLNQGEVASILTDCVEVLGTRSEQAERFANAYDNYLLDPKYLGMIEAGRGAMEARLSGDPEAAKQLDQALKKWATPKSAEETTSGTIAVLFTDIVGSTAMTQTFGDAAAQEVVRTHNRIVRAALTTYQGREVKHTGDGIMASFANTAHAVEAGMYIQRKVVSNNATNPTVPLGIKIGINAGEPIVEDNDLFGTTVQLSARIVDKATVGQVMVSGVVRSICQGKSFVFADRGTREMKGFAEPIQLFEAVWDPDAAAAAQTDPAPSASPRIAAVSTDDLP